MPARKKPPFYDSRYAIPTVNFKEAAHRQNVELETPDFEHIIFGHICGPFPLYP